MKTYKMLTTTLILLTALCWGEAQSRLLYQVSVNFPAFGLPGYRLSENFRNLGFSAGITYPFNVERNQGSGVPVTVLVSFNPTASSHR